MDEDVRRKCEVQTGLMTSLSDIRASNRSIILQEILRFPNDELLLNSDRVIDLLNLHHLLRRTDDNVLSKWISRVNSMIDFILESLEDSEISLEDDFRKKAQSGFLFLKLTIKYAPDEVLNTNINKWCSACISINESKLSKDCVIFSFDCLNEVFDRVDGLPEAFREYTTKILPKILPLYTEAILEMENSAPEIRILKALNHCLKKSAETSAKRLKPWAIGIRCSLLKFLVFRDLYVQIEISEILWLCVQSEGLDMESMFLHQILLAYCYLSSNSGIFPAAWRPPARLGLPENAFESSILASIELTPSNDVSIVEDDSRIHTFRGICIALVSFLKAPFVSHAVLGSVPWSYLIDHLCASLSISEPSVKGHSFTKELQVAWLSLPSLLLVSLDLLEAVLKCDQLQVHVIPYLSSIYSSLLKLADYTNVCLSVNGVGRFPIISLREKLFSTCLLILPRPYGVTLPSDEFIEKVLPKLIQEGFSDLQIFFRIMNSQNQERENDFNFDIRELGEKRSSKKRKKTRKTQEPSLMSDSKFVTVPVLREEVIEADLDDIESLTVLSLEFIEVAIKSMGALMPPDIKGALINSFSCLLMDLNSDFGSLKKTFSSTFRMSLYGVYSAIVEYIVVNFPQSSVLSVFIKLFSAGLEDEDRRVRICCSEALHTIERIIHPRMKPSLNCSDGFLNFKSWGSYLENAFGAIHDNAQSESLSTEFFRDTNSDKTNRVSTAPHSDHFTPSEVSNQTLGGLNHDLATKCVSNEGDYLHQAPKQISSALPSVLQMETSSENLMTVESSSFVHLKKKRGYEDSAGISEEVKIAIEDADIALENNIAADVSKRVDSPPRNSQTWGQVEMSQDVTIDGEFSLDGAPEIIPEIADSDDDTTPLWQL